MLKEVLIYEKREERPVNGVSRVLMDFNANLNEPTYKFDPAGFGGSIAAYITGSITGSTMQQAPFLPSIKGVYQEINLDEWKKAISYSDDEVNFLLEKLLESYNIEPSEREKRWLSDQINELIDNYQKEFQLDLPREIRDAIFRIIVKIAYDRLVI